VSREAESQVVQLAIPAKAEYVSLLRLALSAISRLTPLSGEEVADLKLAVDEAARRWIPPPPGPTAVATQAAEPGSDERLSVRYGLQADRLLLELSCDGSEVMPAAERELSLAILRATADECEDVRGRTRLVKYLDWPVAPAPRPVL
jgi:hypothetical protein